MSDPSFCWLCSKPLKRAASGQLVFSVIRFGSEAHRAHKVCAENHGDQATEDYHAKRVGRDMVEKALGEEDDDAAGE